MIRVYESTSEVGSDVYTITEDDTELLIDSIIAHIIGTREYVKVHFGLSYHDTLGIYGENISYDLCHMGNREISLKSLGEDIVKVLFERGIVPEENW